MKLTEELINFCCKHFTQLAHLADSGDWDIRRWAGRRMQIFCNAVRIRLSRLGLPNPDDISAFAEPSLQDLKQALRAVKVLADEGSLEAMEDLTSLALIAAKSLRNVKRMIYARDHPPNVPWRKKPAEQHGVVSGQLSPEDIKDADINTMLNDLDKRIGEHRTGEQL